MKTKQILKSLAVIAILCMTTACVDKDFRLDEASTEITIAQGTTALKLGYINEKKLEDILGLAVDPETGNYQFSIEGKGDDTTIDGINHSFDLPEMMNEISAEYPDFELSSAGYQLDKTFAIKPKLLNADIPINGIQIPAGYTISASDSNTVEQELNFQVPELIRSIDCVYLKPYENGAPGAKINAKVKLNDLANISAGGHLNFTLSVPKGYALYDEDYKLLEDGCFKMAKNNFSQQDTEFEFVMYLKSINNENPIVDGEMSLPIELNYDLSFSITSRAGLLQLNNLPELQISSMFEYGDAEFVLNDVTLVEYNAPMDNAISIDNLPDEVKSLNEIALSGYSPITLLVNGFEWIDTKTASYIQFKAKLPEYFVIKDDENTGYDAATHTLSTNLDALRRGVTLNLEALSFGEDGIKPKSGSMSLDFGLDLEAGIEGGTKVKLSDLLYSGYFDIEAGIESTTVDIESVTGAIEYAYEEQMSLNIGDINGGADITIDDTGLSPIIAINITNPLTMSAFIDATLVPVHDGVANTKNSVSISNIEIKAAEYANGTITPKTLKLILAGEEHKAKYSDSEYTFVECNIANLLRGNIPDAIDMELSFKTASGLSTLYAAEKYTVSYDYSVDIPLSFSDKMSLSYSDVIDGIDGTFDGLADMNIKVGDIYLVADIATTIPLDLSFDAELLGTNGQKTSAKLIIPNEGIKIQGSTDGTTEKTSSVRLGIDFGEDNKVSNLADVSAIRLTLSAKSASSQASLNPNQYISAQLYIELEGGITVDINAQ